MDDRVGGLQGGEAGAQVVDFRGQAGERLFLLEDIEAGQGGGAAEGIGGVTMAIVERPLGRAEEGGVNLAGGERGGHAAGSRR